MILSSDKLSGLGKPVVQLKLDTKSDGGNEIRENLIELDIHELNALLKVLKQAQAVCLLIFLFAFDLFLISFCSPLFSRLLNQSEHVLQYRYVSWRWVKSGHLRET